MNPESKKDPEIRVQFRTTQEEKAFFEDTAHRCGFKNLSEFLRVSAHEKARREFPHSQAEYITPTKPRRLSAKASRIVAESLLNPPKPNAKLKALLSEERRKKE